LLMGPLNMKNKAFVRKIEPSAYSERFLDIICIYVGYNPRKRTLLLQRNCIGHGTNFKNAWADAADELKSAVLEAFEL